MIVGVQYQLHISFRTALVCNEILKLRTLRTRHPPSFYFLLHVKPKPKMIEKF